MPSGSTVQDDGTTLLYSSASYSVAGASSELVSETVQILPAHPVASGYGRIVHPTLGSFDYEVKPDEWVNIDADAIIQPVWASRRTMGGAANVLWQGFLRDTLCEERWLSLGGLAMPITMLRMLILVWSNPIDPENGYVEWYPNYVTAQGFQVLPVALEVGEGGIALDDVIHAKRGDGEDYGWVTNKVTFKVKLVDRV